MTDEELVIGVDLGGTRVRVGLSDSKGRLLDKAKEKVDTRRETSVSQQIARITRSICKKTGVYPANLKGIGIASAGPLNLEEGELVRPTNLPFDRVSLVKPISDELGIPAYLVNDCTAAVLGEKKFGAGKRIDNLVYVTIGTGIGGGAIVDGHLLLGKDGNAVEIGHLTVDFEGRLTCGCGKKGHWEAYCSGRNIPNFVRLRIREMVAKSASSKIIRKSVLLTKTRGDLSKLTTQILFQAARDKDKLSRWLVNEIGILNAIGFANVVNAYDPSLITVGGTVAMKNDDLVLPPIRKYMRDYLINRSPRIMITPLGEDIGIYGAIATVFRFTHE